MELIARLTFDFYMNGFNKPYLNGSLVHKNKLSIK